MNKLNVAALEAKVNNAVLDYDEAFYEKHKDMLDFGHCGYAIVLLGFGRKRKLKEMFLESDLLDGGTWDSYGRKEYVVNIPTSTVATQYMGFYEGRAEAAKNVLREELEDLGIEVNIHRWVD